LTENNPDKKSLKEIHDDADSDEEFYKAQKKPKKQRSVIK
jgi:hypothetical protein